ncbi:MAG: hypothetical protein ACTTH5_05610 [Wolinella sp.]
MQERKELQFQKLLSFLSGVSMAFGILGGFWAFLLFNAFGILSALIALFFVLIVGLAFMVFFEFIGHSLRYKKHQIELLESLASSIKNNTPHEVCEKRPS